MPPEVRGTTPSERDRRMDPRMDTGSYGSYGIPKTVENAAQNGDEDLMGFHVAISLGRRCYLVMTV
jgi:hypothetical protein